ncbi:MAG TPA: cytochrome c oxidase assembly protein [Burkholderiaceae bacterium]|nr:cytochrome c oxidase assembly protein [Burkholderiaceae bacterium]
MGAFALLRLGAVSLLGLHSAVLAHDVTAEAPLVGWSLPWNFEPWVISCLAVSGALYAVGLLRLWRQAGVGHGVRISHAVSFAGGWLFLVVALVSPLDPLGTRLFSAHMVQHELLMVIVAPLMVVGRPLAVWTWALPKEWRRTAGWFTQRTAWAELWRFLTWPLVAWLLHAAALWLWHIPPFFEVALVNNGWHTLQHASFLVTALFFWWAVLGTVQRASQGAALGYLFTTMVHTGALGALLTLSPTVWYPTYLSTAASLGILPLEDQQLGGLVMWVPAGLVYLAAGLALAARWLERTATRRRTCYDRIGSSDVAQV